MIKKETFVRYADLKEQIAVLTAEVDMLKPEITNMLIESEIEEEGLEILEHGVFTIARRRIYTYPESIAIADKELKKSKKKAEQNGDATHTETIYPLYKPNKA